MRILFIHTPSDLYGASRSLIRLTSRLTSDGNDVLVVLSEDGPLYKELIKLNVKCIIKEFTVISRQNLKGLRNFVKFIVHIIPNLYSLSKLVKQFKPDIIHSNTALIITPAFVSMLYRVKHIWHIREFFSEFSKIWFLLQWFHYFFSDRIICVSHAVAIQYCSFIKRNKIQVIHNGFPSSEFEEISNDRIETFKNTFQLNGYFLMGVVGRIKFQRKGQEVFIQAAKLLIDKYKNVKFLIIGSAFPGNEIHSEKLIKLINELQMQDHVIITGDVADIKAAISALDVSILPSGLPEPFGGVVIESMALGKPVIGTNIGGTIEQIVNNETGFLIPPNEPQALANAMENLIINSKLSVSMGLNGRKRFLNVFEFNLFYNKISSLYKSIYYE